MSLKYNHSLPPTFRQPISDACQYPPLERWLQSHDKYAWLASELLEEKEEQRMPAYITTKRLEWK